MDRLIELLRSESLHARYGAVKALHRIGPEIVERLCPLISSVDESDITRLAAIEAIHPFYPHIDDGDLVRFSTLLTTPHAASLKIELLKLFKRCCCVQTLPAIRVCLSDDSVDERVQSWGFDEDAFRVSTYAADAVSMMERGM